MQKWFFCATVFNIFAEMLVNVSMPSSPLFAENNSNRIIIYKVRSFNERGGGMWLYYLVCDSPP